MRRVLALAANDLRLTAKDRPVVFWMIIMPVAFIWIFGQMGGGGGDPQVSLGVLDEDGSFLSESLQKTFTRQGFDVRALTVADIDSSRAGPRYVRIPAGFQDSIAHARQVPIYFQTSADADAEFSMTAELHVRRAIIKIITDLIETAGRLDLTTEGRPDLTTEGRPEPMVIDERFQAVFTDAAAESSRVTLAVETAGEGQAVPSGMGHSLPATVTLFMLLNTAIYGAVILADEKQSRVLGRVATYPISRRGILIAKLLGRTLLALLQAAILLLAGRYLLGAYLGNSLTGLIVVVVCLALAVGSIALFWGAVLKRVDQAVAVVMVVSLFLGAIGGCWWPLEVVPPWMQIAGHISPAAWAMDGFHAVISFGAEISAVAVPCLVLLGYAVVFTWLGTRLLRFTE